MTKSTSADSKRKGLAEESQAPKRQKPAAEEKNEDDHEKGKNEEEIDGEKKENDEQNGNDENINIHDWAEVVVNGALAKDALTVVLMDDDGFEDAAETGFGDDFQYLCLTIKKEDDDVEVYHVCGPGPHYGGFSCAKATAFLFQDYAPQPDDSLYVYSGDLGNWGNYSFDWNPFVSAAQETRLKGPWSAPQFTIVLETLHKLVHKKTGNEELLNETEESNR